MWDELTLPSSRSPLSAPEHFGDTILFTTDDDILEAIFCSDETCDLDVESLCSLQSEEALQRPSTADGQGEERPRTQAGSWADDRVGLVARGAAWGATGKIDSCSRLRVEQEGWRWMSRKLLALPS